MVTSGLQLFDAFRAEIGKDNPPPIFCPLLEKVGPTIGWRRNFVSGNGARYLGTYFETLTIWRALEVGNLSIEGSDQLKSADTKA